VANSTASKLRDGPRRQITSALKSPLIVSGECVVIAVADAADSGLDASLFQAFGIFDRDVLGSPDPCENLGLAMLRQRFFHSFG
jgi:hypothetical protein